MEQSCMSSITIVTPITNSSREEPVERISYDLLSGGIYTTFFVPVKWQYVGYKSLGTHNRLKYKEL